MIRFALTVLSIILTITLGACSDGDSGPEPECRTDADCEARAGDWTCDQQSNTCVCAVDCKEVCCGDDGCGGTCPDICTGDLLCDPESCTCHSPCQPSTCAELAKECGLWPDNCGGDADCGQCESDEICDPQGQCEGGSCTPNCMGKCGGDDGCGFTCSDSCGATGQTCNGETYLCEGECIPMDCDVMGKRCGMWFDGCGTDLDCGDCQGDKVCNDFGLCE